MDNFIQDMLTYILLYKYVALFLITFFAAFALPLPSTTALMTAAGFASQGYLNVGLVIFWATLGNVAADNVSYWLARRYGVTIFEKIGFRISTASVFSFVKERLRKHARWVIFGSRFEVIMTISVNVLCGITRARYRTFFWYGMLGEVAQVVFFVGIGYFFGSTLADIISLLGEFTSLVIVGVLAGLLFFRKRLIDSFLRMQEQYRASALLRKMRRDGHEKAYSLDMY